jgi:drug/metabolite transporter (DMT)-like permease
MVPSPLHKDIHDKSLLYAVPAVLIWSTVATAFKLALLELDYVQLIFVASGISTLFLFIYIILAGQFKYLKRTSGYELLRSAALGFLNPFAYYLILFRAYSLLPAQLAQPLNMIWPLTLAVLSIPLLKQRITWRQFAAMGISFAGICILSMQGGIAGIKNTSITGVFLALFSSFFWALYWIFNVKDPRPDAVKLFLNFFFGFLYLLAIVPVVSGFRIPGGFSLLAAIYVGLFEAGITYVLWMKAMQLSSNTAMTGTMIFASPFISLVFISVVLKENIHLTTVAGLVLIVAGILYMQKLKVVE